MKAILEAIRSFLFGVPQEAKEMIFSRMMERNLVPEGCNIDDADFWQVKEGDHGFYNLEAGQDVNCAVYFNNKCYYGEI